MLIWQYIVTGKLYILVGLNLKNEMGKLFNPTKRTFAGPWLLNNSSLEELHEIIEYADYELSKTLDEKIDATALKDFDDKKYESFEEAKKYALKYSFDRKRKDITLISNNESRLTDNSIKELLVDPKVKNFKPKELSVDIEYGSLDIFSFNVKQRFDGELEYNVKATKSEVEDEINYRLENWVDKYKPLFIQTWWLKLAFPLAIFAGLTFLLTAVNISSTYRPNSIQVHKEQIEAIIENGVNKENQTEAVELLLKINSGYISDDVEEETRINQTAKRVSIIALAFCLIGIFKPKTIIGIGKHKRTLKFYKYYLRFVLFVIPAIFVYPYIIEFIKNLI
ncbi:hypothetical protein Q2T41_06215 [Maribacter confluentis]|uniref:Uncharacterized protein n=1 Tax=Maribacter confluentis TaxID=1656093 RepID=A0ABT8RMX7_9FLAO|nr:hypothetical protein [Maribacter confluentis]MDO1512246.1 hypothetical protein [Maribacter confluentis]